MPGYPQALGPWQHLPPTAAGSSQHLSSSAQGAWHMVCSVWSWNHEADEQGQPDMAWGSASPARPCPAGGAQLTTEELPWGPRDSASLPSKRKPVAGGLPASPMGLSATFRQSTCSLPVERLTATCTCRHHGRVP